MAIRYSLIMTGVLIGYAPPGQLQPLCQKGSPSITGVHDRGDVAADGGRHCGGSA